MSRPSSSSSTGRAISHAATSNNQLPTIQVLNKDSYSTGSSTSEEYVARLLNYKESLSQQLVPHDWLCKKSEMPARDIKQIMEILLSYPKNAWADTPFTSICEQATQPIRITTDGNIPFTLILSNDVFDYQSFKTYTCNLAINRSGDLFDSQHPSKKADEPDVFVPLGWLAESAHCHQRTTLYVCLWNTSTQPNSIWLAYDYHIEDLAGECHMSEELGSPDYYNCPLDYGSLEDPGLEVKQRLASLYLLADSSRGYLGTDKRFNVGMIITDTNQWVSSEGVTPAQMSKALTETSKEVGHELRAFDVRQLKGSG